MVLFSRYATHMQSLDAFPVGEVHTSIIITMDWFALKDGFVFLDLT